MKQEPFIFYESCPVCGSNDFYPHLSTQDYFLTQEDFELDKCVSCGLVFTNPIPHPSRIGSYYNSDKYYSHPTNKSSIVSWIYNRVKQINLRNKYSILTKYADKGELLDIGCGSGDFLNYAKKHGWKVSGIEPNNAARTYASKITGVEILTPEQADMVPSDHFDVVSMWHVLEHVLDVKEQIAQIKRCAKADAKIIIALPNHQSPDAIHYKGHWAAWDVPRHLYHFNKTAVQNLFGGFGCRLVDIHPMKWDAFYVALLSEKYLQNPFPYFKAIVKGGRSNRLARQGMNYSSLIYVFEKE